MQALKIIASVALLLIPGSSIVLLAMVVKKAYTHFIHGRMEKEQEGLQA